METVFTRHKWMQLIYGILLLVAGVLITIFAIIDKDNVAKTLSVILAIGFFILGACFIFSGILSLRTRLFDSIMVVGAFSIAIGVILCVQSESLLKDIIVIFVGALLLAGGAVYIGKASAGLVFKIKKGYVVLFFVLAAILITLGILALCYQSTAVQVIYIILGIVIALGGILEIVLGAKALHAIRKAKKELAKQEKEETK